ncbi:MAG: hypothetical protein JWQ27_2883 [Ferruginibacter sp.]|nr:hypothetical protein [Ferruginibacter sp.]
MNNIGSKALLALLLNIMLFSACKTAVKQQEDSVYSRHLQRHVALTVITTPMPDNKEDMNLLIFNGADMLNKLDAKKIIDSLHKKKLLQPLTVVGVEAKEQEDWGISGITGLNEEGKKADKYAAFVNNELYPFIKKKVSLRKFHSVAVAGCGLGASSAFDIAWTFSDRFDKVGIFSPDLNYAGKDEKGTELAILQLSKSKKKPGAAFWLYASSKDSSVKKNADLLEQFINKRNANSTANMKKMNETIAGNDIHAWHHQFADFLVWAFGKNQ